jgi:hypothetical protein
MTDPISALIGEEKRWRLLDVTERAMAEALSLEKRADEVYSRILETPVSTLAGILTKLEWGEGMPTSPQPLSLTCDAG